MHVCRCQGESHPTWGGCIRAKGLRIAYCQSASGRDATGQKKWDRDLAAYADARRQGIQPATTNRSDVDTAVRLSDQRGEAFTA